MELLNTFGSDPEISEKGAWVSLSDRDGETGRLRIARMWNPRFKEVFAKYTNLFHSQAGGADANEEEADEIMVKTLAETILVDWEDVFVDGEEFKYSVSNAIKLLSDPRLIDFRNRVVQESSKFSNYRLKSLELSTGK